MPTDFPAIGTIALQWKRRDIFTMFTLAFFNLILIFVGSSLLSYEICNYLAHPKLCRKAAVVVSTLLSSAIFMFGIIGYRAGIANRVFSPAQISNVLGYLLAVAIIFFTLAFNKIVLVLCKKGCPALRYKALNLFLNGIFLIGTTVYLLLFFKHNYRQ